MENSKLRKVRKKKQISDSSSDESDSHPTGGLPLPPAFKDTSDYAEDIGIIRTSNILSSSQRGEKQPKNTSVEDNVLKKKIQTTGTHKEYSNRCFGGNEKN